MSDTTCSVTDGVILDMLLRRSVSAPQMFTCWLQVSGPFCLQGVVTCCCPQATAQFCCVSHAFTEPIHLPKLFPLRNTLSFHQFADFDLFSKSSVYFIFFKTLNCNNTISLQGSIKYHSIQFKMTAKGWKPSTERPRNTPKQVEKRQNLKMKSTTKR